MRNPSNLNSLATFAALIALGCSSSGNGVNPGDPGEPDPDPQAQPTGIDPAFDISGASVVYHDDIESLVFEQRVVGDAGSVAPDPAGQLDGAPVLGYVFPTTLAPTDVGFGDVEGTLALAATSHPDFDDTPLWDEDNNGNYRDDGVVYHSHWVVLVDDERAPAGLAARQADADAVLPPTAPMEMYLDSPGFNIVRRGEAIRIVVPLQRVNGRRDFAFDAVTALMRVDASDALPLLGVEEVYEVLSGDLSLPFQVEE